jgi:hypothetical protein
MSQISANPPAGSAKLLTVGSEQDSFANFVRNPLQGPNTDLSGFTSAEVPCQAEPSAMNPTIIDLCDEAPAPASALGFIRRPNRHGEGKYFLP